MFVCLFVWETAFIFNLFSLQPIYHLTRKNKIGPAFIFIVLSFECWSRPFPLPASVSLLIACPFLLPSETTCMSIIVSFVILISKWKYIYIYILYFFFVHHHHFQSSSFVERCDSKVWLEFRLFFKFLLCLVVLLNRVVHDVVGWLVLSMLSLFFFFFLGLDSVFFFFLYLHMTTFD